MSVSGSIYVHLPPVRPSVLTTVRVRVHGTITDPMKRTTSLRRKPKIRFLRCIHLFVLYTYVDFGIHPI
ncbi:unnamed protein product [Lactuca virosa]|uniref:Uncharacterized protein n=1 Tax=Lactuca virosa TaxID=75947 RepID=A0AAU9NWC1_9ASTR|nr:unnamed protein product [Lactuca virosa]